MTAIFIKPGARTITAGIAMMALPQLLVGAIPATLLALGADRLFGLLQRMLTPAGMRAQ